MGDVDMMKFKEEKRLLGTATMDANMVKVDEWFFKTHQFHATELVIKVMCGCRF